MTENAVRLAVVNTPFDSGLLEHLLTDFGRQTGIQVTIHSDDDPFARALSVEADLIIAHYGKAGMAEFVSEGYGSWPKMVFSNQAVLIGPKNDPAHVADSASLSLAFRAIAESKQTLIANNNQGISELVALTSTVADQQLDGKWYRNLGVSKSKAIKAAEKQHAYVIWGAVPFLKFQQTHETDMKILFSADPSLQRVMAITRVSAEHFPQVNGSGAKKLESYLLSNAVQAQVVDFRMPDSEHQLWWPAARHN
ncbi:hypothetical protein [Methylophaga sp.]|uniref:hypothetical protein n=1 Tax=Methylophaga sp. TaxID=2024840 RepID=UPI003F6A309F